MSIEESMKGYLLGKLGSSEADALEDLYFADRQALLRMDACEQELFNSYIDDRLSAEDRNLFERKYLQIPELIRRLDEARGRNAALATPRRSGFAAWLPALAGLAMVLIITSGGIYFYASKDAQPAGSIPAVGATIPPPLIVTLAPGIVKGTGKTIDIDLPAVGTAIRFLLELPGVAGPLDCLVDISIIEPNGRRAQIWRSSRTLPAKPAGGGLRLTLDVDSAVLRHADYIMTVHDSAGAVVETYVFRVSPNR